MVPPQAGLHRYGQLHRINHLASYLQHLWYVLQHAGTCTLACHLLYRAAKVQVDKVGTSLFYYLCGLNHRVYIATINLYTHRALCVADGELRDGRLNVAYQRLGAHKLSIHHSSSKPLAQQSETNVCHIFHRCQKHRILSELYISYLHFGCKVTPNF